MIDIKDKKKCCGCTACVQACPKKCINLIIDEEGFSYPKVNMNMCINCGLCEKVCPALNSYEKHRPIEVLAAINKNNKIREDSSSGGIFSLLASQILDKGGVVFGARFDKQWQVVIDCAETEDAVADFRGSKYLQASIGDSFVKCKRFLDEGREILFSGSPCQIAGLKHFLRIDYDNLLTVDFICHGVPSPKVWNKYLEEVLPSEENTICDVRFRDKRKGWKDYCFTLIYESNGQVYPMTSSFSENLYTKAFLENLILRPSCHACPAKDGKSHSDITIADFWGIDKLNPKMDDDRGTSLVMIHTEKGKMAVRKENLIWDYAKYEDILKYNPAVSKSALQHPKRNDFFSKFSNDVNLHKLIKHCLRPTRSQAVFLLKKLFNFRMKLLSKMHTQKLRG